jgi:hypothetical protein
MLEAFVSKWILDVYQNARCNLKTIAPKIIIIIISCLK